jgi:hypothetical protein
MTGRFFEKEKKNKYEEKKGEGRTKKKSGCAKRKESYLCFAALPA